MKGFLSVMLIVLFSTCAGCGGDQAGNESNGHEQGERGLTESVAGNSRPAEPPMPEVRIDDRKSAFQAVDHSDNRVRWIAVKFIKENSQTAYDDLKRLMGNSNEDVICAAVNGLRASGPAEEVMPLLAEAMSHTFASVQTEAVINLGEFGEAAREYVPAIETAMETGDDRFRQKAELALKKIAGDQ